KPRDSGEVAAASSWVKRISGASSEVLRASIAQATTTPSAAEPPGGAADATSPGNIPAFSAHACRSFSLIVTVFTCLGVIRLGAYFSQKRWTPREYRNTWASTAV